VISELVNPLQLADTWARAAGNAASSTRGILGSESHLKIASVPERQGREYRQNFQGNPATGEATVQQTNDKGDRGMVAKGCQGPMKLHENAGVSGGGAAGSSGRTNPKGSGGSRFQMPN